MTDRQQLLTKLDAASKRSKVQHYILETVRLALQDNQISSSTARTWLTQEGLKLD
jgi:hypothetical protein